MKTAGPQFFITTDNPTCLMFPKELGLSSPPSQFYLPLSPTHALNGSWYHARHETNWIEVGAGEVVEANKWLISQMDVSVVPSQPRATAAPPGERHAAG